MKSLKCYQFLLCIFIIWPLMSQDIYASYKADLKSFSACLEEKLGPDSLLFNFLQERIQNYDREENQYCWDKPGFMLAKKAPQEAIWSYKQSGDKELAHLLKLALEEFLFKTPMELLNTRLGTRAVDGETEVYKAKLVCGLWGYYKPKNPDRKSNYENEIAAYGLDQLWQFNMIPAVVEKIGPAILGSLQIAVKMDTAHVLGRDFRTRPPKIVLFDYLIRNTDRHLNNFGYLKSGYGNFYPVAIDHSLAFFTYAGPFCRKGSVAPPALADAKLAFNHNGKTIRDKIKSVSNEEIVQEISYLPKGRFKGVLERLGRLLDDL